MPSNSRNTIHNQSDELYYLERLGKHAKKNRIKCLNGYIESAELKTEWGRINKKEAIDYAKQLIKEEGGLKNANNTN